MPEHLDQQIGVTRMEPDTRLVQYIKRPDQATPQRSRQIDTLAFSSGKRGRQAVKRQIAQPHIQQELQAVSDLRQQTFGNGCLVLVKSKIIEKGFCFRDRKGNQFRNILSPYLYIKGFGTQTGPFASRANGLSTITRKHHTVLYLIQVLFHKFKKVIDAVQSAGTVPKQVFLLLRQIVIRTMDREVIFLALHYKLFQPFSHHIAFPADYRSLENRQAFIRHDQIFIDTEHLPETFASRAGA